MNYQTSGTGAAAQGGHWQQAKITQHRSYTSQEDAAVQYPKINPTSPTQIFSTGSTRIRSAKDINIFNACRNPSQGVFTNSRITDVSFGAKDPCIYSVNCQTGHHRDHPPGLPYPFVTTNSIPPHDPHKPAPPCVRAYQHPDGASTPFIPHHPSVPYSNLPGRTPVNDKRLQKARLPINPVWARQEREDEIRCQIASLRNKRIELEHDNLIVGLKNDFHNEIATIVALEDRQRLDPRIAPMRQGANQTSSSAQTLDSTSAQHSPSHFWAHSPGSQRNASSNPQGPGPYNAPSTSYAGSSPSDEIPLWRHDAPRGYIQNAQLHHSRSHTNTAANSSTYFQAPQQSTPFTAAASNILPPALVVLQETLPDAARNVGGQHPWHGNRPQPF